MNEMDRRINERTAITFGRIDKRVEASLHEAKQIARDLARTKLNIIRLKAGTLPQEVYTRKYFNYFIHLAIL